jgi:hypothetical protein
VREQTVSSSHRDDRATNSRAAAFLNTVSCRYNASVRYTTDRQRLIAYIRGMKELSERIVIHAEVLHNGDVLLTFSDASCAIFSSASLCSMLHLSDRFVDKELKQVQAPSKPPSPSTSN